MPRHTTLKSEEKPLGIGKVNLSFIHNGERVKRVTFRNVGAKMTYESKGLIGRGSSFLLQQRKKEMIKVPMQNQDSAEVKNK